MSILVECRACHRKLKVQDEAEGKKIKCPNCAAVFRAIPSVTDSGARLGRPAGPPKTPTPEHAAKEPRPKPAVERPAKPPTAHKETQPVHAHPAKKPPAPVVIIDDPAVRPPAIHKVEPPPGPPNKPPSPVPAEAPELFAVEPVKPKKAVRPAAKPAAPRQRPGTANTVGALLIFGLFLVVILGGGGYWLWTTYEKAPGSTPLGTGAPRPSKPALPLTQPATNPNPPTGDPATDLEKEIEQAGHGVKLAPFEVTMSGVTITLMAPADSRAWSNGGIAGVDDASFRHFNLSVRAGKIDHSLAKEIWKSWPKEKVTALLIDTKDLVLREFTTSGAFLIKDGTYYRFTLNQRFGHLGVYFSNTYATREDCLLMLKCARTATLKEPYAAPATLADLEKLDVKVQRDGAKVTGVRFGKEPLTDGMLAVLAKELPDLEVLDLGQTAITDDGLRALADMKNLRRLILPFRRETVNDSKPDNVLNGSGLVHLAGLTKLEGLWTGNAAVTDSALVHLKGLRSLKKLSLDHARVTGSGFADLSALGDLEELTLNDSLFGDEGVKHLAAFKKLSFLSLMDTPLTGAGFADFEGLPRLKQLQLFGSKFGDAGLKGLAGMTALEQLEMTKTQVTGVGFAALKDLRGPLSVTLKETPFNDDGLRELSQVNAVGTLNLEGTKITDAGVAHLKGLSKLRGLSLSNTAVTGAGFQALADMEQLKLVQLAKTPLTEEGCKQIGTLKNVTELELADTPVTNAGLKHFEGLKSVEKLDLDRTKVTDAGLKHLVGLEKLSFVKLEGTQIGDDGLETLKGLKKLEQINAGGTKVTKEAVEKLKKDRPEVKVYSDAK